MKRIVFALLIVLAAIPAAAQLCPDIPEEDGGGVVARDLRLATYKVMSDILDESTSTACHNERLQLAQFIANSPGEWWRIIAEYRQAQLPDCTTAGLWNGLTYDQLVTNLNAAWTEVSELRYGGCTQD
jgi:hypothetical protein